MNTTAAAARVGVDLSKHVFELAVADEHWRVVERARLSRSQFVLGKIDSNNGSSRSSIHLGLSLAALR